jgi:hypothetical protein
LGQASGLILSHSELIPQLYDFCSGDLKLLLFRLQPHLTCLEIDNLLP